MKKIISCEVYRPYIERLVQQYNMKLDIEYLEIKQHDNPEKLNKLLKKKIDENKSYNDIYLLYGVCGNAIIGLKSKTTRLHIIKVHDCMSVLLGGKEKYKKIFEQNPSQKWACESYGFSEDKEKNYKKYVELYGEENAKYLLEVLDSHGDKLIYLDFGSKRDKDNIDALSKIRELIVIEGKTDMLERILFEKEKEILMLQPGEEVELIYDMDEVMRVKRG